jgi:DNA polymerase elongation subunit (family B)
MTTHFHILDATWQDVKVDSETEMVRTIEPLPTYESDDDDEIQTRRKRSGAQGKVKGGHFSNLHLQLYLFGTTADGSPLRAMIEGFQPFFFVRLPLPFANERQEDTQESFQQALSEAIKSDAPGLRGSVQCTFEKRNVLYGYTADQAFPFARLSVASVAAFRALRKLFIDSETSKPIFHMPGHASALEVFEANLDPMLRFFHLRKIKPCGWVTVKGTPERESPTSPLTLEADWEDIGPCHTPPMASAPFLLASWDIECYSENGEFPLAKKGYGHAAKLVYANAINESDAATLLLNGALYPDSPPAGMDPLRKKEGKPIHRDALEATLLSPQFQEKLAPLLTKREGLAGPQKEQRITSIRQLLESALGTIHPLAGDPIIQIGVVLVRTGSPTEKHVFVLDTCNPVEGATVHAYKTEKALLAGWGKYMAAWNPDILVGYNVFGFDEKYCWQRAQELGLTKTPAFQFLTRMGDLNKEVDLEEKFLSSSALGDNTMFIWTAHGRLQVDLYHYIKRSFSLPAYKLDSVCQHFMSGKLSGIDTAAAEGRWFLKTKSTADVVVGRFLVLLDETGDSVVEKLQILEVDPGKGLTVEAPQGDDLPELVLASADAVKWAIVKDDVSPQDIFRLQRGTSADRAKVAAYCIQDCDLVVELYKKLDVFNNAMAMANACSVPVSYIFTRGQGIKIESLIFKECYERGQCIQVLPTQPRSTGPSGQTGPTDQEDSYEGAIVLPPNPGFYKDSPIGVADFASLYPSTIISENISHDTLVWAKDYDLNGKFLCFSYGKGEAAEAAAPVDVQWTDIEFDIWAPDPADTRKHPTKIKRGVRVCRYAQFPGQRKGTLPEIVRGLLAARKAKRKEAEKENDPFKKALLDAEQLAYKLTANSLYGQLGSGTFKVRLQHLAASVTSYGRKQILFAKAAIEDAYGPAAADPRCCAETVYGDTDSLFINFNVKNPETGRLLEGREAIVATMHLTEEAGKRVSNYLKAPHDFEYDKVFSPFIIFSKKRYVGNKFEESPDDYYQNSMGIATKRRDYAGIVKIIYGGAIRILLTERDPIAASDFVKGKLMDLAEGKVSMNQLTITKSLRAEYNSPTPPAHKMLAERIGVRDPGNKPASGDRISYLYVLPPIGQVSSKLQGDRIETPTFIKEKGLQLDAKYYMEHQLMNPISQLFALLVEQLPGSAPPPGRTWSSVNPSEREGLAADLLFRDALAYCDRAAVRRFGDKFGLASASTATKRLTRSESKHIQQTPQPQSQGNQIPQKQMSLLSYLKSPFLQEQLLKAIDKPLKRKSPTTPLETSGSSTSGEERTASPAVETKPETKEPPPKTVSAAIKRTRKELAAGKKTVNMEV